MKRLMGLIVSLVLLTGLLTGCAGTPETAVSTPQSVSGNDAKKGRVAEDNYRRSRE